MMAVFMLGFVLSMPINYSIGKVVNPADKIANHAADKPYVSKYSIGRVTKMSKD